MQNSKNVPKKRSSEVLQKPNEPNSNKKASRGSKVGKSLTG